jgi:hypothetical protein
MVPHPGATVWQSIISTLSGLRWPSVKGSPADKIAEAVSSLLVAAVPFCL